MGKIYDIEQQIAEIIENGVDPETGEFLLDEEKLNDLQMERDRIIEGLILMVKDGYAMEKAIKAEAAALSRRAEIEKNKADRIKSYIAHKLKGEKFETAKVKVSYTHSKSVEVSDGFIDWAFINNHADLITVKEPTYSPNKAEIKKFLNSEEGKDCPTAWIEDHENIQIK